jgi:hypothetical protein
VKPTSLYNIIGNNPLFYFTTGARDRILALGGPRDEIVPKENYIPRSGLVSVGASYPISIRVDHKFKCE